MRMALYCRLLTTSTAPTTTCTTQQVRAEGLSTPRGLLCAEAIVQCAIVNWS